MPGECIFCKMIIGEMPANLLYNDSKCFVILDIFPSQRGHMLVITKEHRANLLDTSDALSGHLHIISKCFAKNAKGKLGASAVKIVVNIGRDADQLIDHTHMHVIPFYPKGSKQRTPHEKMEEKEAAELIGLLSEVGNAREFQTRNLGT